MAGGLEFPGKMSLSGGGGYGGDSSSADGLPFWEQFWGSLLVLLAAALYAIYQIVLDKVLTGVGSCP